MNLDRAYARRLVQRDPLLAAAVQDYTDAATAHNHARGSARRVALQSRYAAADVLGMLLVALLAAPPSAPGDQTP